MRRALRSASTRRSSILAVTMSALLLAACGGSGDTHHDVYAEGGWQGVYADGRNSASTTREAAADPAFDWSRPLGGTASRPPTVAPNGQIYQTAATETGCNMFSFQITSERKRWCTRLAPSVADSAPLLDGVANAYVGDGGTLVSFTEHGQTRWRTLVDGTPLPAQFTGDGNVLVVTHRGQVQVLDTQTGFAVTPPLSLLPQPTGGPAATPPPGENLEACFLGTDACPVALAPAVDGASGRVVVSVFTPSAPAPILVGLRYSGGDTPSLVQEWDSGALPSGPASAPVLSADGETIYVHDREGTLWALSAEDGTARWLHDVGYVPAGSPSVADDGTIVVAGGESGALVGLRDAGDDAEELWRRDDVVHLGVPAQSSGGVGHTVVRDTESGDEDGLALLTFDTASGETRSTAALPGGRGFSVGTAVGPDGEIVTTTAIGEVFVFGSPID
ncbi:cell surface protein [Rhodococcus rhodnii]|uniref:Pyrrolo-quinoline quinone repeat domain-containing protein n=2 Tax=Rhodococcus rhodnii TaxID=38312 RepID=R7WLX7_9NOCA|nr:PQQ-binding-like beta-propeller repeat protein [Rhodococcus rhodnii]EOM76293.1 hypothetical protein Rrhod_2393 [Rhodococcus rhodnii LMG 5362]TXG90758.1 cell surface protein [Rhodococcus rhodnii]